MIRVYEVLLLVLLIVGAAVAVVSAVLFKKTTQCPACGTSMRGKFCGNCGWFASRKEKS